MVSLLSLHSVCGFHGAPECVYRQQSCMGGAPGDLGWEAAGTRKGRLGGEQGGLGHLKNQIKSWLSNAFLTLFANHRQFLIIPVMGRSSGRNDSKPQIIPNRLSYMIFKRERGRFPFLMMSGSG